MNHGRALGALLFDPRGRMSRQDLLVAATIMLALDFGIAGAVDGPALYAIKALAYWIGGVGIVKRLHDTGNTGWWLLWGACALCMWSVILGIGIGFTIGLESLQAGGIGYIALLAALMLPALGATLWLHLALGQPGMNRYGPEPSGILDRFAGTRQNSAALPADL
ncbi:MAG: DUF805 domain-containing protein [Beijerinckiaceae bacterium]